jgi:hypothetical protein
MSARKKTAAKAASEPAETGEVKGAAKSDTAVAPLAAKDGVPTYRTDLGESLPPQKYAGVE